MINIVGGWETDRDKDNTFIDNIKDIDFYYAGYQKCTPGHFYEGIRDHYIIHYIFSGKGIFETEDNTYNLKKGNGFLIFPGQTHFYRADDKNPWEYCWFALNGMQVHIQHYRISFITNICHSNFYRFHFFSINLQNSWCELYINAELQKIYLYCV